MKKTTAQLKIGDTIKVWWRPGRDTITALKPYTGPLLETLGNGTKLADFALNSSGMTLEAGAIFEALQRQPMNLNRWRPHSAFSSLLLVSGCGRWRFLTKRLKYMTKNSTWIQGIGEVPGKPASALNIGDKTLWNGPTTMTVASRLSETTKSITLRLTDDESGKEYSRRFLRETIVALRPLC